MIADNLIHYYIFLFTLNNTKKKLKNTNTTKEQNIIINA